MTALSQIFRKDLARLWPWVVLWNLAVLGLALQLALDGGGPPGNGWGHAFWTLVSELRWLVGPLLVALLLQADGSLGGRAQWLSRPVSGIQLLSAKVLFFALLVALPAALAEAGALLVLGLEPVRVACVVVGAARFFVPLFALAGALAALSPGLASFAAALVVGSIAFLSADRLALAIFSGRYPGLDVTPLLDGWRAFAWASVVLLALAVLIYQYTRRNTMRSLVALGVTPPLVLASALIWELPAGPLVKHTQKEASRPPAVEVLREEPLSRVEDPGPSLEDEVLLMARLSLTEPPTTAFYELKIVETRLDFGDGARVEVTHPGFSALGIEGAFSSLFDGAQWLGPQGYEWTRPLIWPVPEQALRPHAYEPVVLEGRLGLDQRSLSIAARTSLEERNGVLRGGPEWLELYRLPPQAEGAVAFLLSGQRLDSTLTGRSCRLWAVLHNPSAREIAPTRFWDDQEGEARPSPLPWPALRVLEKNLTLGDQWPPLDSAWLEAAEVVVVRDCLTTRYRVPIRLDGFIPADYTPDAHRQRRIAAGPDGGA